MFYWLILTVIATLTYLCASITYLVDLQMNYDMGWVDKHMVDLNLVIYSCILNEEEIFFFFLQTTTSPEYLLPFQETYDYYKSICIIVRELILLIKVNIIELLLPIIYMWCYWYSGELAIIITMENGVNLKPSFNYDLLYVWLSIIGVAIITILARGIGPRFRPDQLSDLTWKDLLILLIGFLLIIFFVYIIG